MESDVLLMNEITKHLKPNLACIVLLGMNQTYTSSQVFLGNIKTMEFEHESMNFGGHRLI